MLTELNQQDSFIPTLPLTWCINVGVCTISEVSRLRKHSRYHSASSSATDSKILLRLGRLVDAKTSKASK